MRQRETETDRQTDRQTEAYFADAWQLDKISYIDVLRSGKCSVHFSHLSASKSVANKRNVDFVLKTCAKGWL